MCSASSLPERDSTGRGRKGGPSVVAVVRVEPHKTATVLPSLGRRIDSEQIDALPVVVERLAVQRLGYLPDHLRHDKLTGPIQESLRARGSLPWAESDR